MHKDFSNFDNATWLSIVNTELHKVKKEREVELYTVASSINADDVGTSDADVGGASSEDDGSSDVVVLERINTFAYIKVVARMLEKEAPDVKNMALADMRQILFDMLRQLYLKKAEEEEKAVLLSYERIEEAEREF